jgi:hypothetical protein
MKIAAIGEVLWDILPWGTLPEVEHLGGAPFNFAWHARNLGYDVSFISAVGKDDRLFFPITGSHVITRFPLIRVNQCHPCYQW